MEIRLISEGNCRIPFEILREVKGAVAPAVAAAAAGAGAANTLGACPSRAAQSSPGAAQSIPGALQRSH